MRLELKMAKAKATNYLRQLSFASMIRDSAWADGLHLGFETFKTWMKDPARKIDLNMVHIKDIPCTSKTIHRLTSLGREEMPNAPGINKFNYDPHVEEATKDSEAREASTEGVETTPAVKDPPVNPQGEN
jgi:hypothetical protein